MTALSVAWDLFRDPVAALRLFGGGKEGLHRLAVGRLLGQDSQSVNHMYSELQANKQFQEHVRAATASAGRSLGGFVRPSDLYVICRSVKPKTIVETGVASGLSSAFILQALDDNAAGRLYSIDLPNADTEQLLGKVLTNLPEGREPGWVVPDWLRSRWDLRLGRTSDMLPQLVAELGTIDIFLHDSEHSLENMTFEFNLSWPVIAKGGLLLSDDVNLPSTKGAFYSFAKKVGRKPEKMFSGYGAIRK